MSEFSNKKVYMDYETEIAVFIFLFDKICNSVVDISSSVIRIDFDAVTLFAYVKTIDLNSELLDGTLYIFQLSHSLKFT